MTLARCNEDVDIFYVDLSNVSNVIKDSLVHFTVIYGDFNCKIWIKLGSSEIAVTVFLVFLLEIYLFSAKYFLSKMDKEKP